MFINFGRDVVFSADLCYNRVNEMPPFTQGSLWTRSCNLRGMGFARSLCNTKAKLAIKQNDKQEFDEVMKVKCYKNKMIAPIIITVVVVLYYVVYFGFFISLLNTVWKYAFGMIPLVFSAIMVKVCIERINEIKKGEEDDISKY